MKPLEPNNHIEAFVQRIIDEKEQLDERLEKLERFLASEKVETLDSEMRRLMTHQAEIMGNYSYILDKRLELLNIIPNKD